MPLPNIETKQILDIKPYSYHRGFVSLALPQKAVFLPMKETKLKILDISEKVTNIKQNRIFLPPLKNKK